MNRLVLRRAGSWLFWLILWQLASMAVGNAILLVGPFEVLQALFSQAFSQDFWLTVAGSFGRICLGFLAAFFLGLALGTAAWRFPWVGQLLEPFMSSIRSVPVASFVILALIWVGSGYLAVFIAFLVVLPMIYVSTAAGLSSADQKLLEMARVFRVPALKRIRFIYLPALTPYLASGCRTALGMSWKSGIAAEVIGIPSNSIGEQLYYSKLYLDTAGLFAWTLVIIIVSALFERGFLLLLGRLSPPAEAGQKGGEPNGG